MWEGRGLESHLGQLFFYLWKGGDLGVVPVDFLVIVWKLPFKCIRRGRIANVQLKPEKRSIKSSWALALPIIHKAYLFSQVPTPFILSTHSPRAPPLIEYNVSIHMYILYRECWSMCGWWRLAAKYLHRRWSQLDSSPWRWLLQGLHAKSSFQYRLIKGDSKFH